MFKQKGGGVKGLLNNVKKTALFLRDGFPKCTWKPRTVRNHDCNKPSVLWEELSLTSNDLYNERKLRLISSCDPHNSHPDLELNTGTDAERVSR